MSRTNNCIKADYGDNDNNDGTLKEILFLHYGKSCRRLQELNRLILLLIQACHRSPRNFKNGFVGAPDQEARVADCRDRSDDAAGSNNSIAGFQLRDCLLQFALPLLLRSNKEHVKHGDDKQHRDKTPERSKAALKEH